MKNNIKKVNNRTVNAILNALDKGKSYRQIGDRFGLSHQKVWRIGAKHGVFSIRSGYID